MHVQDVLMANQAIFVMLLGFMSITTRMSSTKYFSGTELDVIFIPITPFTRVTLNNRHQPNHFSPEAIPSVSDTL